MTQYWYFDLFFRYCTAVDARPVLQLMNEQEFIHFSKNAKRKDWQSLMIGGELLIVENYVDNYFKIFCIMLLHFAK